MSLVLAVLASLVAFAPSASAHKATLIGEASCYDSNGNFTVTWTLTNDTPHKTLTLESDDGNSGTWPGLDLFTGPPTSGQTGNIFTGSYDGTGPWTDVTELNIHGITTDDIQAKGTAWWDKGSHKGSKSQPLSTIVPLPDPCDKTVRPEKNWVFEGEPEPHPEGTATITLAAGDASATWVFDTDGTVSGPESLSIPADFDLDEIVVTEEYDVPGWRCELVRGEQPDSATYTSNDNEQGVDHTIRVYNECDKNPPPPTTPDPGPTPDPEQTPDEIPEEVLGEVIEQPQPEPPAVESVQEEAAPATLPRTGGDAGILVLGASMLMGLGAAFRSVSRRRG